MASPQDPSTEAREAGGRGREAAAHQLEGLEAVPRGRGDPPLHILAVVVPADRRDVGVQADRVPAPQVRRRERWLSSTRRHDWLGARGQREPGARNLDAFLLRDLLLARGELARLGLLLVHLLAQPVRLLRRQEGDASGGRAGGEGGSGNAPLRTSRVRGTGAAAFAPRGRVTSTPARRPTCRSFLMLSVQLLMLSSSFCFWAGWSSATFCSAWSALALSTCRVSSARRGGRRARRSSGCWGTRGGRGSVGPVPTVSGQSEERAGATRGGRTHAP